MKNCRNLFTTKFVIYEILFRQQWLFAFVIHIQKNFFLYVQRKVSFINNDIHILRSSLSTYYMDVFMDYINTKFFLRIRFFGILGNMFKYALITLGIRV